MRITRLARVLLTAVLAAGAALTAIPATEAQRVAFSHDTGPRVFKACRLLIHGQENSSRSLVFEGMRRFPDRPAGWDLENPLAPPALVVGDVNVVKSDPAYWGVHFNNTTAHQIVGFDLLYIHAGTINMTSSIQRNALVQAVHEGAVLWIDQAKDAGNPGDTSVTTDIQAICPPGAFPTPPAPPFTFVAGAQNNAYRRGADQASWLLRFPFNLEDSTVNMLGVFPRNTDTDPGPTLDAITIDHPGLHTVVSAYEVANPANQMPQIAVTRYGAGAVVVTCGDIGYDVANWWRPDTPAGITALKARGRPYEFQAVDIKFAWNVAAFASEWSQTAGSGLSQGISSADVGLPLEVGWQFPGRFTSRTLGHIGAVTGSPVVGDGMVFALSLGTAGGAQPLLICLDADPPQDLIGDGRADDGADWSGDGLPEPQFIDYARGESYDLVWFQTLGSNLTPRNTSVTLARLSEAYGSLQVALVSLVERTPSGGSVGYVRAYNATVNRAALSRVPSGLPAAFHTPGALLWTRVIPTYSNSAAVVALSTPAVFDDYIYVLASEFDNAADGDTGTATINDAYGRTHAFNLNYRWDVDQAGAQWVYPDPTDNPNNDGDVAGDYPPPHENDYAYPEYQKSLPPFQDPAWVAGVDPYTPRPEIPPLPDQKPVLSQRENPSSWPHLDVLLAFSTPVSFLVDTSTDPCTITVNPNRGGCNYVLIPAIDDPLVPLNNDFWYRYLPNATPGDTIITSVVRNDDGGATEAEVDASAAAITPEAIGSTVYARIPPQELRELLLPSRRTGPGSTNRNPLYLPYGATITFNYESPAGTAHSEDYWISGFMRQGYSPGATNPFSLGINRQRTAGWNLLNKMAFLSDDTPENDDKTLVGNQRGYITARKLDIVSSADEWRFAPDYATPNQISRNTLSRGGLAVDRKTRTAYAAVTQARDPDATPPAPGTFEQWPAVPQLLGFNIDPRLDIQLHGGGPDSEIINPNALTVQTLAADGTLQTLPPVIYRGGVPYTIYTIHSHSKALIFNVSEAGFVSGNNAGGTAYDPAFGPLWGKPIWVTYQHSDPARPGDPTAYTTVNNELHLLPDIVRFQYTPEFIRLRNRLVNPDSLSARLPSGRAVAISHGEVPSLQVPVGAAPVWATGYLPHGLVDARNLVIPGVPPEPLRPGSEILISYTYWDPVINAERVVMDERYQVPLNFGESVSTPALAGNTIHVGTEGYQPTRMPGVGFASPETDAPGAPSGPVLGVGSFRNTLLSVLWDPVSRVVRGALSPAAYPEAGSYGLVMDAGGSIVNEDMGIPVTTSSPVVDRDRVFVGVRLMRHLSQVASYQGENLGYVSGLKPNRTLICDTNRLIEVVGGKRTWTCLGTLASYYHEHYRATGSSLIQTSYTMPRPFNRPAKAIYVGGDNILVVDTGNNRVVEIDREGRQVWPLDSEGFDYYTSIRNSNIELVRPGDVSRYYVTRVGSDLYHSPHGRLLANTEMHTVIADTGQNRVIDIVTTLDANGNQVHRLDILTPSHVRSAGQNGMTAVSYTKVQPIFDPGYRTYTGADARTEHNPVIGYVCAAGNMHQLVIVEAGSRVFNPPAARRPVRGSEGSNWGWWAWLYDSDITDDNMAPDNPLHLQNIRDISLVYEGAYAYLTVTAEQFSGRHQDVVAGLRHPLSYEGAGVFEFCMDLSGLPGDWHVLDIRDAEGREYPVWYFTRVDYLFGVRPTDPSDPSTGVRRQLAHVLYEDANGTTQWLPMGWNPVSASRLPGDQRPIGPDRRLQRHLVTNAAQMVQNLSRDTVDDLSAPASLYSSVFVVVTDDRNNDDPFDDVHDVDRRQVIPDPNEPDWTDPFNQPAYATRG